MIFIIAIIIALLCFFISYCLNNSDWECLIPVPLIVGIVIIVTCLLTSLTVPYGVKNVELIKPSHVIVTEIGVLIQKDNIQLSDFSEEIINDASKNKDLTYILSYDKVNMYNFVVTKHKLIIVFDDEDEKKKFEQKYNLINNNDDNIINLLEF